jgi:rare lipoprotein A
MLVLSGCAETRLAVHAVKSMSPPPTSRGTYKLGTPYQVDGVWYYPAVDETYDETGIASWYGAEFHQRATANGEVFDMHRVSAAHKTLPLPSVVLVTNLENGRALKVRVNDRGPFVHGRIIDLSYRAAELLGMMEKGTAKVRVQYVKPDSDREIAIARGEMAPAEPVPGPLDGTPGPTLASIEIPKVSSEQLVPLDGAVVAAAEPVVQQTIPHPDAAIYVQAGAFAQIENADRLKTALSALGPSRITEVVKDGRTLYRVRLGPMVSVEEGDALLARVLANGHKDARLIVAE